MGGGGYNICIGHRAGIFAAGYKACEVGHVYHEKGSYFVGNGCHSFEINNSGVGAGAADNQFRLYFLGCFSMAS